MHSIPFHTKPFHSVQYHIIVHSKRFQVKFMAICCATQKLKSLCCNKPIELYKVSERKYYTNSNICCCWYWYCYWYKCWCCYYYYCCCCWYGKAKQFWTLLMQNRSQKKWVTFAFCYLEYVLRKNTGNNLLRSVFSKIISSLILEPCITLNLSCWITLRALIYHNTIK